MSVESTTALHNVSPVSEVATRSQRKREIPRWLIPVIVQTAIVLGQVLVFLACRISLRSALRLSRWVTLRVEPLTRPRRQANLRMFFQSALRTEAQLQSIDNAHQTYLARMRAEVARCFSKTQDWVKQHITLEGEKNLQDVLARKRGALIVSGHTGTWWFIAGVLAAKGYPVTAVFTPIHFKKLERKLLDLAGRFNVRIAFVGRDAYKTARRAIERNEILYLTFDVAVRQHRSRYFPFGGGKLQVDPGPAIMAVRNSMPSLQAACTQLDNEQHCVSIYAPTPAELNPQTSSADELCLLWTQRLEKEVETHPEQWWALGYVELVNGKAEGRRQNAEGV